jgi:hypothetical protein
LLTFSLDLDLDPALELDPDPHSSKRLDPDPYIMCADPKHCHKGYLYLYHFLACIRIWFATLTQRVQLFIILFEKKINEKISKNNKKIDEKMLNKQYFECLTQKFEARLCKESKNVRKLFYK